MIFSEKRELTSEGLEQRETGFRTQVPQPESFPFRLDLFPKELHICKLEEDEAQRHGG